MVGHSTMSQILSFGPAKVNVSERNTDLVEVLGLLVKKKEILAF